MSPMFILINIKQTDKVRVLGIQLQMDLVSWVLVISELFSAFVRLRALKLNFSIFCHFLPL